jgi:hypothetical protein
MVRRKVALQSQAQISSPNQPAIRSAHWAAGERGPSGYSDSDIVSLGFIATPKPAALIENTRNVASIDVGAYDAILVAGGQGPMFTFEKATALHRKFVEFYEAGKIACALCHGVAVLRYARLSNGEYLAKGKSVTGFANVEEDFADNAVWQMNLLARDKHVMPWRIEDLEEDRRQLHARRALARLCGARRKSGDRSTEFLTARNR